MTTTLFIVEFLGYGFILVGAIWTLLWLTSLKTGKTSIVDTFWGMGFIFANYWYQYQSQSPSEAAQLASMLVLIWGLRLSLHIGKRAWGKPEDFRYQAFRKNAPNSYWWRSYFTVFLLQAALVIIISTPLASLHAAPAPRPLGILQWFGLGIWLIGFLFETVGDMQLQQFKKDPANKGQLLTSGLWSLTRHPNYFGDALLWWGLWLICADSKFGLPTIFAPILMTWFLYKVTGAALLDKSIKASKPGADAYFKRTPAFFPRISNLWK